MFIFFFQLETKFAGLAHAPGMADYDCFRCGVRFEGKNVLQGIKQMVSAGIAVVPLPNHLANVKSLARNKIIVRSKTKNGEVRSSPDESNKTNSLGVEG